MQLAQVKNESSLVTYHTTAYDEPMASLHADCGKIIENRLLVYAYIGICSTEGWRYTALLLNVDL